MADSISPWTVGCAFVKQYYEFLNQNPVELYRFYTESSMLGWEGSDGLVKSVTTLSGIKEEIMSSDLKNCRVEVVTTDSQESLEGGVIVVVNGLLSLNGNMQKEFNQTFFVAKQETGFFVLNDILRFSNERELTTSSVVKDNSKKDQEAVSAPSSVVNEAFSAPDAVATIVSDSHAVNNEAVNNESDTDSKASISSVAKVDSKISYASVAAKAAPLPSPEASSNAVNRVIRPPVKKASSTPRHVSAKESTAKSSVSVNDARNGSTKTSTAKSSVSANDAPKAARKIYIGNLPRDITKKEVAEAMKKFGPVRTYSDSIQITCYEDGFCYGFVDFESPDGALRAVEAQNVQFGDKRAYITYKKSNNRASNGEAGNKQRPQSGNRAGNNNGQVRDRPGQNRS